MKYLGSTHFTDNKIYLEPERTITNICQTQKAYLEPTYVTQNNICLEPPHLKKKKKTELETKKQHISHRMRYI